MGPRQVISPEDMPAIGRSKATKMTRAVVSSERFRSPTGGSSFTASANFRMRRTSSSMSCASHVFEDGAADPLARRVHQVGHGPALRGDDGLAHAAVGGTSPAFHQAEAFELGDLTADGRVIAPDAVGQLHDADRAEPLDATSNGNSARSSGIPASLISASSRCGRFMALTMSSTAP